MKQNELKPCAVCRKGVMNGNQILCSRVRVTRLAANLGAIQRQHGLELMLGRSAGLAFHMGPQEDLLKPLGPEDDVLVCDTCAMHTTIMELAERIESAKKDAEEPIEVRSERA